jgi:DNA-dependent metalloprotease WSS1
MFSHNILRINDSQTHPNPLIYFISSLKSSSRSQQATKKAEEILFRVAAIGTIHFLHLSFLVYPIMKKNGLKVKSLKEHAWNPVFAGRNFNAGEVIELVLTGRNGAWAHEGYIVSVMLHELSHCLK